MIVVDASTAASALALDDAKGEMARARLSTDPDQHAPGIFDLEVVAVVRRLVAGGLLDDSRAGHALSDLAVHPLVRYPHVGLLWRIWQLRRNVSPYDAAYVALAEALQATLLTSDARLARAPGPTCSIELLA